MPDRRWQPEANSHAGRIGGTTKPRGQIYRREAVGRLRSTPAGLPQCDGSNATCSARLRTRRAPRLRMPARAKGAGRLEAGGKEPTGGAARGDTNGAHDIAPGTIESGSGQQFHTSAGR